MTGEPGEITWLRYVAHERVEEFQALGWVVCASLPLPHGLYSVLMEFAGDGDPTNE